VEYYDTANFGRILIHLKGSADENSKAIHFLNRNNIKNIIKGYA
jgi:D-methionine transport system ATP-binding protein